MQTSPRILVLYYSATGHVFRLAQEVAAGAVLGGAQVRIRRAAPETPGDVHVQHVSRDDLRWADGVAVGTPMPMALSSPQLHQFIDVIGGTSFRAALLGKIYATFTASGPTHDFEASSTPLLGAEDLGRLVARRGAQAAQQTDVAA
jgi:NAD(P)H dehydrogenase (quinone)